MKQKFYKDLQVEAQTQLNTLKKTSTRYMLYRTLCFFALIFALAAGYDGMTSADISGAFLFFLFIWLIHQHNQIKAHIRFVQNMLTVTEKYLSHFHDDWQQLPDKGDEFIHPDRPQDIDLHIFGKASLFQYLCCARTALGRKKLAQALSVTPPSTSTIRQRQDAVAELIKRQRLCVELLALNQQLPANHDTAPLLKELTTDHQRHIRHILQRTAWLLPFLTFISLALALAGLLAWHVSGLLILLQFAIAMVFHRQNQAILAPLHTFNQELHTYLSLFIRIGETNFTSPVLQQLATDLSGNGAPALRKLAWLTDRANLCRNLFFFVLGNGLLLWDCHCATYFSRWQDNAAQHLGGWLNKWAEMELCLSLAMVGHTRQQHCFPQLLTERPHLATTALTSLLIREDIAIPNDTTMGSETRIITGSNMSGKTTYMRTLASSLVLAYAGAPVCAQTFICSPLHIFTSIQVHDDQSQGISTFYAELLRIKQMIDFSKKEQPMLICIDEIFKGTNSADRIVGAREAISRLTRPYAITLVSTHDFELCDLPSPNEVPVTNYHFAEYYEDNKIKFDYKIKNGRCQTTNAQYLLKMAGIL
ncbi:MAG: DNA mismatch repair protein MutS [Selenomonas sp.]|uniref:MutS-related protein n=1 Tax=Selenomonas sp. TaxID=2053611 RepID=UPI0025E0A13E|nr:DNA mismatch repair protein MutS [Selenomonas sp.]MCR5756408.1 DNA mismatch repair protein MutS [Selenomonas sp.]